MRGALIYVVLSCALAVGGFVVGRFGDWPLGLRHSRSSSIEHELRASITALSTVATDSLASVDKLSDENRRLGETVDRLKASGVRLAEQLGGSIQTATGIADDNITAQRAIEQSIQLVNAVADAIEQAGKDGLLEVTP